jgi:hypothetical protein
MGGSGYRVRKCRRTGSRIKKKKCLGFRVGNNDNQL